jgi:hypothetical protein
MDFAYQIATFLVGLSRYRAGVYNRNIGILVGTNTHKTAILELASQGRALGEVQFTTECMKINFASHLFFNSKNFSQNYTKRLK